MLGDFASLDVQNTYRGSDAYVSVLKLQKQWRELMRLGVKSKASAEVFYYL
ncbi:hypothetical protein [Piscirickettsia salmonis]|uniref:hypothetical protein n=1 Tax=Piscirickettsia salmonis TaxID=1238 RepID=UPI0012BA1EA5|nr:hypothetical protein [Piscirickettsia salmonis]